MGRWGVLGGRNDGICDECVALCHDINAGILDDSPDRGETDPIVLSMHREAARLEPRLPDPPR